MILNPNTRWYYAKNTKALIEIIADSYGNFVLQDSGNKVMNDLLGMKKFFTILLRNNSDKNVFALLDHHNSSGLIKILDTDEYIAKVRALIILDHDIKEVKNKIDSYRKKEKVPPSLKETLEFLQKKYAKSIKKFRKLLDLNAPDLSLKDKYKNIDKFGDTDDSMRYSNLSEYFGDIDQERFDDMMETRGFQPKYKDFYKRTSKPVNDYEEDDNPYSDPRYSAYGDLDMFDEDDEDDVDDDLVDFGVGRGRQSSKRGSILRYSPKNDYMYKQEEPVRPKAKAPVSNIKADIDALNDKIDNSISQLAEETTKAIKELTEIVIDIKSEDTGKDFPSEPPRSNKVTNTPSTGGELEQFYRNSVAIDNTEILDSINQLSNDIEMIKTTLEYIVAYSFDLPVRVKLDKIVDNLPVFDAVLKSVVGEEVGGEDIIEEEKGEEQDSSPSPTIDNKAPTTFKPYYDEDEDENYFDEYGVPIVDYDYSEDEEDDDEEEDFDPYKDKTPAEFLNTLIEYRKSKGLNNLPKQIRIPPEVYYDEKAQLFMMKSDEELDQIQKEKDEKKAKARQAIIDRREKGLMEKELINGINKFNKIVEQNAKKPLNIKVEQDLGERPELPEVPRPDEDKLEEFLEANRAGNLEIELPDGFYQFHGDLDGIMQHAYDIGILDLILDKLPEDFAESMEINMPDTSIPPLYKDMSMPSNNIDQLISEIIKVYNDKMNENLDNDGGDSPLADLYGPILESYGINVDEDEDDDDDFFDNPELYDQYKEKLKQDRPNDYMYYLSKDDPEYLSTDSQIVVSGTATEYEGFNPKLDGILTREEERVEIDGQDREIRKYNEIKEYADLVGHEQYQKNIRGLKINKPYSYMFRLKPDDEEFLPRPNEGGIRISRLERYDDRQYDCDIHKLVEIMKYEVYCAAVEKVNSNSDMNTLLKNEENYKKYKTLLKKVRSHDYKPYLRPDDPEFEEIVEPEPQKLSPDMTDIEKVIFITREKLFGPLRGRELFDDFFEDDDMYKIYKEYLMKERPDDYRYYLRYGDPDRLSKFMDIYLNSDEVKEYNTELDSNMDIRERIITQIREKIFGPLDENELFDDFFADDDLYVAYKEYLMKERPDDYRYYLRVEDPEYYMHPDDIEKLGEDAYRIPGVAEALQYNPNRKSKVFKYDPDEDRFRQRGYDIYIKED